MLCVGRLMRRGDQRGSDNSQCKRRSAHGRSLSAFSGCQRNVAGIVPRATWQRMDASANRALARSV
jgi:hypothetical protein